MKLALLFLIFLTPAVPLYAQNKATIFTFRASAVQQRYTDFKSSIPWGDATPSSDLIVVNNEAKTIKFYDAVEPIRLFVIHIKEENDPDTLAKYNAADLLRFKCIDDKDSQCSVDLFLGKDAKDVLILYNIKTHKEYQYFVTFQGGNAPLE